ncbi:unnamed protein product [Closterium sp. Naga37s-1]|nr:unnamed protein product [Closterium sp. Naga37s-1]
MRACLAPAYGTNETVITVDEYVAREGRDVAIDHIACVSNHSCFDNWSMVKEHYPHITLPDKLEYPTIPSKDVNDFLHAYAPYNDAPVISLGNAFGMSLIHLHFFFWSAVPPFKSTCADIWLSPPVIDNFVNGFIDTFLGSDYAAVHLRRSDFALHYLKGNSVEKTHAAYLPIVTVAQFIVGRLKDTGASVVYLATDASPSEIELLERLLLGSGSTTPLVVVRLLEFAKGSQEYSQFPWIKEHFPHITLPNNLEYPSIPTKHVTDFLRAYAPYNDAPVISLGDAFHFVLRGPPFYFEGAVPPFTSTCADIWQPPLVIDNFVNGFVGTFLGSEYAAVHLRRGDFAGRFQNKSSETDRATFLPVVTVARFISERLRDTGVSVVYLATDASPSEIQLLEKLFLGAGSTNPLVVVRLPEFAKESEEYSQFRWVKKFQDLDSEGNGSLRALAEKHICANARFFIGTQMSTFSLDIRRLRLLHERMSEVDAYFSDSNA